MSKENEVIARRFVKVLQGHADPTFGELFAPKIRNGHIYTDERHDVDAKDMVSGAHDDAAGFKRLMSDYEPTDIQAYWGDDGFTIVRSVSGTLEDGTKIYWPTSFRATVVNGKITSLISYLDRQQTAVLGDAMKALRAPTQS